jgi:hypothetical protein
LILDGVVVLSRPITRARRLSVPIHGRIGLRDE